MKRHLGISLFFGFLFMLAALPKAEAQDIHGVLRVVKGDVRVVQADGQEIKAKIGQKIYPKDTIIAGPDSRAKVIMVDNNEININPDSKIQIQNYEYKPAENKKNVLINIVYGKVRASVNQKYEGDNHFQVKTPSAVAGVRGTDFVTSFDPKSGASNIVTFRGNVAFGQPGPNNQILNAVGVTAGNTSSMKNGSLPSTPSAMPKAELAKLDKSSDADKAGKAGSNDPRQPATDNKKGGSNNSGNNNGPSNNSPAPASGNMANTGGSSTSPTVSRDPSSEFGPSPTPSGTGAPSASPAALSPTNGMSTPTGMSGMPNIAAPAAPMPMTGSMIIATDLPSSSGAALAPPMPQMLALPPLAALPPVAPPLPALLPANFAPNDNQRHNLIVNIKGP